MLDQGSEGPAFTPKEQHAFIPPEAFGRRRRLARHRIGRPRRDPATAATPSGITREAVLSIAASARADGATPSDATRAAAAAILVKECNLTGTQVLNAGTVRFVKAVDVNPAVDGVYLDAFVTDSLTPVRECSVGLVATLVPGASLTGTASMTTTTFGSTVTTPSTALSGDVSVITERNAALYTFAYTYAASGTAAKTTVTTTTTKVKDTKTKAQKKAAKKKYDKRLKAAKKSYKKVLAKAGKSKTKKAAAKKSYKAKRASAKAKYRTAIANFKLVKKSVTTTDSRPFSVKAEGALEF